jgi:hypothetical protein
VFEGYDWDDIREEEERIRGESKTLGFVDVVVVAVSDTQSEGISSGVTIPTGYLVPGSVAVRAGFKFVYGRPGFAN